MRGKHAAPPPPDLEGRLFSNFALGMTGVLAAWAVILTGVVTFWPDPEQMEFPPVVAEAIPWTGTTQAQLIVWNNTQHAWLPAGEPIVRHWEAGERR